MVYIQQPAQVVKTNNEMEQTIANSVLVQFPGTPFCRQKMKSLELGLGKLPS
jgi:hypothetical protein